MSEDNEPVQGPEEIEPIRPMDPDGPHYYNYTPPKADAKSVTVPEAKNIIDDKVSTPVLLWTGLKELMASVIVISTKARILMAATDALPTTGTVTVETKRWYESKTLWLNGLTFAWYFIGPMVGIPILSAEVTGVILTGANILLRAITKAPVTIQ